MRFVALPDKSWPAIDATSLVTAAGPTSYDRGVQYLREGAVTRMSWDRGRSELYGSVDGSAGSCYETVAYFHPAGHVGAGVRPGPVQLPGRVRLQARRRPGAGRGAGPAGPDRLPGGPPGPGPPLTWEQSVQSWLGPQPAPGGGLPCGGQPAAALLGIELTLVPDARPAFSGDPTADDAPPRLMARLVRPGRKGWVAAH